MSEDIFYIELQRRLETMTPRSRLFKVIQAELKKRGHWKNKPRGVNKA